MGHNHMITGVVSTLGAACAVKCLSAVPDVRVDKLTIPMTGLRVGMEHVIKGLWSEPFMGSGIFYCVVIVAGVLLGSLLPDLDHDKSMLGRFVHINVPHRTWTHAIWWPLILMALGLCHLFFFWVGFGWLLHELWDNASKAGNCFFYPISQPIVYAINSQGKIYRAKKGTNPAKSFRIKKNHKLWLYRAGQFSEKVVVYVQSIVIFAFAAFATYMFV